MLNAQLIFILIVLIVVSKSLKLLIKKKLVIYSIKNFWKILFRSLNYIYYYDIFWSAEEKKKQKEKPQKWQGKIKKIMILPKVCDCKN